MLRNCIIIERVTDAAGAADEVGFALLHQCPAEADDTGGDGAFIEALVAPHLVKQLLASEDAAGMSHQELQEPKLEDCERDQAARAPCLQAHWIEHQVGEVELFTNGDQL